MNIRNEKGPLRPWVQSPQLTDGQTGSERERTFPESREEAQAPGAQALLPIGCCVTLGGRVEGLCPSLVQSARAG